MVGGWLWAFRHCGRVAKRSRAYPGASHNSLCAAFASRPRFRAVTCRNGNDREIRLRECLTRNDLVLTLRSARRAMSSGRSDCVVQRKAIARISNR